MPKTGWICLRSLPPAGRGRAAAEKGFLAEEGAGIAKAGRFSLAHFIRRVAAPCTELLTRLRRPASYLAHRPSTQIHAVGDGQVSDMTIAKAPEAHQVRCIALTTVEPVATERARAPAPAIRECGLSCC